MTASALALSRDGLEIKRIMPRFTDQQLESFFIDPREPAAWSRCPFCGLDIVLGVHTQTRNIMLAHSAHADPADATRTKFVSGCERFNAALKRDDVVSYLYNAGARFQKLSGGGPDPR